MTHFIFTF